MMALKRRSIAGLLERPEGARGTGIPAIALVSILAIMTTGCSDQSTGVDAAHDGEAGAGPELRIMPFAAPQITLQVNQTHEQWVTLSQPAVETTYVDVVNGSASLSVSPLALAFPPGKDQQKATIKAITQTGDLFVPVTFSLRGGGSRTLEVKVILW
jgi:hypothetical protein